MYNIKRDFAWGVFKQSIDIQGVISMIVNTNALVSITEANQNFSKVARLVDENGAAIILKNNVPKYVIMEFSEAEKLQFAPDEDVAKISEQLIEKNLEAYKELAK